MNRPYVICHILSSLDGKDQRALYGSGGNRNAERRIRKHPPRMNADAWLYGTTTVKEFLNFREPMLAESACVPEGDFVAGDETKPYFVALDAKGELGWGSEEICQ